MQALARSARPLLRLRGPGPLRQLVSEAGGDAYSGTFPNRSVCKAVILGRTGSMPSLYEFDDGSSRLTFSVATEDVRVQGGVRLPDPITQWNRVVVSEGVPGYSAILRNLAPGSLVYVEGALKTRKQTDPEKAYSEFVSVAVSRGQGTFRVINFGKDADPPPDGSLPF
jgi:single-stranded DNA-binding protein